MRVMILYEHCSPHQVTAVEAARLHFQEQGHTLFPVEFYFGSLDYGWTFGDKPRPTEWRCLFPSEKKTSDRNLYRAVIRQVRELQIDVVVINGWYGRYAWWLVTWKKWIGSKMVMVSDSVMWDFPRKWYRELPKKMLLSGIDAGFVAGKPQAEYLQSLGMSANRLTQGNDVVDNALYEVIPIRTQPTGRKVVIGTAARLIPKKNLASGINALASVLRKHPEWQIEWQIAGRGPLEEELKTLAREQRVPVVFRGFIGYYDMPDFYRGLDLYWQPSLSEPWGLVVNEAMASGLPVLVSDRCGCARDLVTSATGWVHEITQPGMECGLVKALIAQHEWPQRGLAARELIKEWDNGRFSQGLLSACQIAMNQHHDR